MAFANGTVALVAMFAALGIGPGDEVIVPSLTFVSSATSIVYAGATPVFADVDPDTFNLDPVDAARRLTPGVKAILAVHYGGQAADLAELAALADEAGVCLLEDAAEAHGAHYRDRPVGTWGDAAMFSFTPTKNITTGEGGMVTTDRGDLADRLRLLRNHGQTAPYEHTILGCNWRMTEMQAAMGRCQVAKLDAILARKAALAEEMGRRLEKVDGIQPPVVRPDRDHVYMLYTVKLAGGTGGRDGTDGSGRHRNPCVLPARAPPTGLRGAEAGRDRPARHRRSGRTDLSLPMHSRLTLTEVAEVADELEAASSAGSGSNVINRAAGVVVASLAVPGDPGDRRRHPELWTASRSSSGRSGPVAAATPLSS